MLELLLLRRRLQGKLQIGAPTRYRVKGDSVAEDYD